MTNRREQGSGDRQMAESQLSELQNMRVLLEEARGLSPRFCAKWRAIDSEGNVLRRRRLALGPTDEAPALSTRAWSPSLSYSPRPASPKPPSQASPAPACGHPLPLAATP